MLKPLFDLRIAEYKHRTGRKFNRRALADKLGLSLSHISGIFNGRQFTTTENLFIIADMLGCKVDDLYELVEEDKG